jgi:hypothetical protein
MAEPNGLDALLGDDIVTLVSTEDDGTEQRFELPRRAAYMSELVKVTTTQGLFFIRIYWL